MHEEDYATAGARYAESLALNQETGSPRERARLLNLLGYVAQQQGQPAQAANMHRESLSLSLKIGYYAGVGRAMEMIAILAAEQGQAEHAARLCGAVEALFSARSESPVYAKLEREAIGAVPYERAVAAARAELGDDKFSKAWAAGTALTLVQAVAEAKQDAIAKPVPLEAESPAPFPAGLTAREVDVLRLVARGLTDAQVAEQLVLSTRTVSSHLHTIYGKLDVTTRTGAVRVAIEHKLV